MSPTGDLNAPAPSLQTAMGRECRCIPLGNSEEYQRDAELGFVLPYVLAVIFVVSLLTILSARLIDEAQAVAFEREARETMIGALDQAEETVLDTFLKAANIPSGLDLSGRVLDEVDLLDGVPSENGLPASAIWRADGGLRYLRLSEGIVVEARYQDAEGLLSLNSARQELIERWLSHDDWTSTDPQGLAAKLADYRDEDNFRQYKGGERADYRQLGREVPTNSSLRSPQELQRIIGWESIDLTMRPGLLEELTWYYTNERPRRLTMPAGLTARLGLDDPRLADLGARDFFSDLIADTPVPGPRAQFALTACPATGGRCWRRVIEVEKTLERPDFPYHRRLVIEYPLVLDELVPVDAQFIAFEAQPTTR